MGVEIKRETIIHYIKRDGRTGTGMKAFQVDGSTYKKVNETEYLGMTVTEGNNMVQEIKNKMLKGNRCCCALQRVLFSKSVRRKKLTFCSKFYINSDPSSFRRL